MIVKYTIFFSILFVEGCLHELNKNKKVMKRTSKSLLKRSSVVPETHDQSVEITSVYKIMWSKNSMKKHKTFDDGFMVVKGNVGILKDSSDKDIGKITNVSKYLTDEYLEGKEIIASGKVIQIDSKIESSDYKSGKAFIETVEEPKEEPKKVHFQPLLLSKPAQTKENGKFNPVKQSIKPVKVQQPLLTNQTVHEEKLCIDPKNNIYIDSYIGKFLREHQIEGVKFMYQCLVKKGKQGCILADEMVCFP